MQPENWLESADYYSHLAGKNTMDVSQCGWPATYEYPAAMQTLCSSGFCRWDVSEITDTPEARALAASRNHKEAEKRRRQRINSHLNRLRCLLSCNSKTDKASLLAKVIERVKELKQQTSEFMQLETFPYEADEITILTGDNYSSDGRLLIKASLCCEDRSELIPELIETLKSLHLSPLKAEMVTIGGRIRNAIILASDQDQDEQSIESLKESLKSLVHRSSSKSEDRSKRRRMFHPRIII